jgi:tetratricopeptide (TPR) repeat protein
LAELLRERAKPGELVTVGGEWSRPQVSRFLLASGMPAAAKEALASGQVGQSLEFDLAEAQVALASGDLETARRAINRAASRAPRDPRAALIAADIEEKDHAPDKAIEILQTALGSEPTDVDLNRKLVALLAQTDHWQAVDRALDGLRAALAASGASNAEANLAAAHVYERRGQYRRAVSEYQAALAHLPDDLGLLFSLAHAAEQSGSVSVAIDTYGEILRRAPAHPDARTAMERIRRDKKQVEVFLAQPSHTKNEER